MRSLQQVILAGLAAIAIQACSSSSTTDGGGDGGVTVEHVLLVSVDGMHQQDLANCITNNTCPHLASLAQTGAVYSSAYTPGLSDSFPGLAALVTGGSPKTTGLFYDVSYDRTLFAPSDSTCSGDAGWNVVFDETTGIDGQGGGALVHLNGGGDFNPDAIPHAKDGGNCVTVYPHNYILTNTIFEVVKQNISGSHTAWADKHAWGYDWVNGPSGKGVDDLARTEINSLVPDGGGDNYTSHTSEAITFDGFHVQIILNQIDGKDSNGNTAAVPTLFGTNFQSLSVAEKANNANDPMNPAGGGYTDANFTPGTEVTRAIAFVDTSIGQFVSELQAKNLLDSTLIIVTAKHGQTPSDYTKLVKHGDTLTALLTANNYLDPNGNFGQFATTTGNLNDGSGLVGTGIVQTDDVGLIWLRDQSQTAAAVATLQANPGCADGGICISNTDGSSYILSGSSVMKFGDPANGRTPDIIVQPNPGVIYTGSKSKDMEHGGNAPDDSHLALLVSLPSLTKQTVTTQVTTTQVAATIVKSLGLDPNLLYSVKSEGTAVLPNLPF
jgi:predicted AlkP superfamily pyrophosphatase or phosphodiesterase